ncbi:MAG: hypothetical protein WCE75_14555, partial [Terracidiphilus sp.]
LGPGPGCDSGSGSGAWFRSGHNSGSRDRPNTRSGSGLNARVYAGGHRRFHANCSGSAAVAVPRPFPHQPRGKG